MFKTTWIFVVYYNIYILQRVHTLNLNQTKAEKNFFTTISETGVTSDNKQNINFIYSTCAFLIFDTLKAVSHDTSYIQQFVLYFLQSTISVQFYTNRKFNNIFCIFFKKVNALSFYEQEVGISNVLNIAADYVLDVTLDALQAFFLLRHPLL